MCSFLDDEGDVGVGDLPGTHMPVASILCRMLEREDAVVPERLPSRETLGRWIAVFLMGNLLRCHQVELVHEHRRIFDVAPMRLARGQQHANERQQKQRKNLHE